MLRGQDRPFRNKMLLRAKEETNILPSDLMETHLNAEQNQVFKWQPKNESDLKTNSKVKINHNL